MLIWWSSPRILWCLVELNFILIRLTMSIHYELQGNSAHEFLLRWRFYSNQACTSTTIGLLDFYIRNPTPPKLTTSLLLSFLFSLIFALWCSLSKNAHLRTLQYTVRLVWTWWNWTITTCYNPTWLQKHKPKLVKSVYFRTTTSF